jgi:DNA polymerase III epsilon subunit-like protein
MEYYIVDTETTGLDVGQHEISEISIIRYSDKHQITRFIYLNHPEKADPFALEATGRKRAELNFGLSELENSKEKIVQDLISFLEKDQLTSEHRCFIAHNASFDRRFLHALFKKTKCIFPVNFWLDTIKIIRREIKKEGIKKPKVTLEASLEKFGVKSLGQAHRAKFDAQNLFLLFQKFQEKNIDYLENIERCEYGI